MPVPSANAGGNGGQQTRRGAAAPPAEAADSGKTNAERLEDVRAQMRTERDPVKLSALAKEARELSGRGNLFAEKK
jgi:hypothetical protein